MQDPAERALIERVPWAIDGRREDTARLLATLASSAPRLAELPLRLSIVLASREVPKGWRDETIASLRAQSFARWDLIESAGSVAERNKALDAATGDAVVLVEEGDLLHPTALGVIASNFAHDPALGWVYTNEATVSDDLERAIDFVTKPELDVFTLLRLNYVGSLAAIRRSVLDEVRERSVFRERFEGCEDHDLFLRLARHGARALALPLVLRYARRPRRPDPERTRLLLEEHLAKVHPAGFTVTPPPERAVFPAFSVRPKVPRPRVALAAIVPFRDRPELTLRCLESLERQEHSLALETVLVDNGSREPGTRSALEAWLAKPRRNAYRLVRDEGAFNFARINNRAVREHAREKELVLFLNNDVELVSRDALEAMAAELVVDDRTAFVGARLMYPRGEVQHGGVRVLECFASTGYYGIGHAVHEREAVRVEHTVLAVTFACAMCRRSTFEDLGGLDEEILPNGFGDVDLCLRAIEAGLGNRYLGTVEAIHDESSTRGVVSEEAETAALHERHAATIARFRLRHLGLDIQPSWAYVTTPLDEAGSLLPLRYRIADRLNLALKRVLGPLHAEIKRGLVRRSVATPARRDDPRRPREP
ncbi:MAG TPA: glycosyltransferase [Planctomycetota bacterium]|nr:glycosyltransferase [Planctomycetota bacterium]